MKLLFVIKTMTLLGGGAEKVLTNVSAGLASIGHDVTLVSFDPPDTESFYKLHPALRWLPLGLGQVRNSTHATDLVRRIGGLRRVLVNVQPDVATGFMHSAYVPLAIAAVGTGVPLVASEHIVFTHYRNRPLDRVMLRLTPYCVEQITAVSEAMRLGFPDGIRRKMVVVPNPVSIDIVGAQGFSQRRDAGSSARTVLSVGRLEEQKDHDTLIRAFGLVSKRFPGWQLRILGEGVLRAELEKLIDRMNLCDRVSLPGSKLNIAEEYARADIFAMPSRYESFGLATAEALTVGLPVVGFADCPGTNELVRDGVNGILVCGPDRVAALAEGLALFMGSPPERARMGAAGPPSVEQFAIDRIVERWDELLKKVAGSRRRPGRGAGTQARND